MKYATIDIETTGLSRYKDEITYIGVGKYEWGGGDDDPISLGGRIFKASNGFEGFKEYCDELRKQKFRTVFQNGKFDTLFLEWKLGVKLPIHHDVMVMGTAYDLSAEHGLKAMAKQYLGVEDWDISTKEKTKMDDAKVIPYLKCDVKYTFGLFVFFMRHMTEQQMKVYEHLLKPAYLMYRDVERKGIYIDVEALEAVRKQYKAEEAAKLAELKRVYDINWNSPQQVADALFNKEGLPVQKLSEKTGKPSADAKVLKKLAAKGYKLPQMLLDYKFYYGANSKFLNKWGEYAAYDGRIHPNFNITNVVTGRTSCSDPNLQQVPRNKELRSLYHAPKGRVFIEADYSQLELRIAADYANEPTMLKIYREGGDIHTETAKSLSGTDTPTKEQRNKAKAVNFGFLYGMSAKGFIEYAFDSYGQVFTKAEAEKYRELFFAKYNRLLPWHEEMAIECEMLGGVANRFGRFRHLPKIYSSEGWERGEAVRRAINTPVQGTGSDLLLLSAIQIHKELGPKYDVSIVGTVHDSILAECPEEYAEVVEKEIRRIMAHPAGMDVFGVTLKVPLECDVGIGPWGTH